MREVVYKNLTSAALRKKDIFLKEVLEENGMIKRTERRCFYFIKEIIHLDNAQDLQKWIEAQKDVHERCRRHFYIMKEKKEAIGEEKVLCKVAGSFYVILDTKIYHIAFLHAFRVIFEKAHA